MFARLTVPIPPVPSTTAGLTVLNRHLAEQFTAGRLQVDRPTPRPVVSGEAPSQRDVQGAGYDALVQITPPVMLTALNRAVRDARRSHEATIPMAALPADQMEAITAAVGDAAPIAQRIRYLGAPDAPCGSCSCNVRVARTTGAVLENARQLRYLAGSRINAERAHGRLP